MPYVMYLDQMFFPLKTLMPLAEGKTEKFMSNS